MDSLKAFGVVAALYFAGFSAAEARSGHRAWVGLATLLFIVAIVLLLWLEDQFGRRHSG